jgi:hypothetical protein
VQLPCGCLPLLIVEKVLVAEEAFGVVRVVGEEGER